MESSHGNDAVETQSLFSLLCESGKFSPHICIKEANAVKFSCLENGRRNIITCKDKNLDEFISEVNSLDMNTANIRGVDLLLGENIPVVPKTFFGFPTSFIQNEVVAVTIGDIFTSKPLELRDGRYRVSRSARIKPDVLNSQVFQGKKAILLFDAQDTLLEYLWDNREDLKLFDALARVGFYAVTTPNFSLFRGECPVGHALNLKKGLECGVELENRGVAIIPHVYAVHYAQIERWNGWLKKNPSIKTIAMNCQLQRRSQTGRDIAVFALRHLLLTTNVNVILHGSDKYILNRLAPFKTRLRTADTGIFKRIEILKLPPQLLVSGGFLQKVSVTS